MKKLKILGTVCTASLALSLTLSPAVDAAQVDNEVGTENTVSNQASKYITADAENKMYHFDEETFKTDTNASPKEVEKIKNNVNQINQNVQGAKHVTVENGELVTYISDDEINQELEKQGLKETKSSSNKIVTEAAKKGGVTKVTYGKKGKVNLYMSHKLTTTIANGGISSGIVLLSGLGGIGGAALGTFVSTIITSYSGKAVPKNGIIVHGKVDGSITSITKQ
ncbi:hypothetical protein NGH92_08755 [Staphylococcus succinus]|uniref:hypothetical protein n=1 Tax=Staphylococcus TaxID=1279 RepID=UPI0008F4BADD|nr:MULTISPECIES: hypothetical protein [Staphylococcus]MEB8124919.1 hypothetical protein [Staphylococcus succinus]OIJ28912.1 hypothetical protein BK821_13055 [Staphylococcus sp. LCT-H4]PTJ81512.1 hypothetical protein BU055_11035 [Staphylococcus succinus]